MQLHKFEMQSTINKAHTRLEECEKIFIFINMFWLHMLVALHLGHIAP